MARLSVIQSDAIASVMKFVIAYSLVLTASLALALPLKKENAEKYVFLPIKYVKNYNFSLDISSSLERRDVEPIPLENQYYSYQTPLTIGTPGRPVTLDISITCSDSWIYGTYSSERNLTYIPSESSTYRYVDSYFRTGSFWENAIGAWISDTVTIGGSTLENQPFGFIESSSDTQFMDIAHPYLGRTGVLCLGYDHGKHIGVLQNLRDHGYIARNVFSLFLDHASSTKSGSLLFGAVDSKKYTGPLKIIDLTKSGQGNFQVKIAGISVGDRLASGAFDAFLDCNNYYTFLPSPAVNAIVEYYGAEWESSTGRFVVKELPSLPLIFDFDGITISVDPTEIFFRRPGPVLKYGLTILPSALIDGSNILGISFLRSAYTIFDLERDQISLAQSLFNSTESDIIRVTGDIPGATHI